MTQIAKLHSALIAARQVTIDHAGERGLAVPEPRCRPAIYAAKFAA